MRRQPVAFFLGDAAFLSDSKFRALARRLPDPDDFNSAVGAFFIALAHARRNGIPEVSVHDETQSRFVDDLVAVGLVTDSGFRPGPFKDWAPSRPPRPNELASKETDVTSVTETTDTTRDDASTPLPSTPIPSGETDSKTKRETVPSGREDVEAFILVRQRPPSKAQQGILDDVLQRHDVSGPGWAADIILQHPEDPIGGLLNADRLWREERIAAAKQAERKPPQPKRRNGLPESARELLAYWAAEKKADA